MKWIVLILLVCSAQPCWCADRQVRLMWDHSIDKPYLSYYHVNCYDKVDRRCVDLNGEESDVAVSVDQNSAIFTVYGDGSKCEEVTFNVTAVDGRGLEGVPSNSVSDGRPWPAQNARIERR